MWLTETTIMWKIGDPLMFWQAWESLGGWMGTSKYLSTISCWLLAEKKILWWTWWSSSHDNLAGEGHPSFPFRNGEWGCEVLHWLQVLISLFSCIFGGGKSSYQVLILSCLYPIQSKRKYSNLSLDWLSRRNNHQKKCALYDHSGKGPNLSAQFSHHCSLEWHSASQRASDFECS